MEGSLREQLDITWRYQLWRIRFRAYVLWQALGAALFWFGMMLLSGLLNANGIGWLAWIVVGGWLFFAIPGLLFQIQTIADIASYLLTGRTTFYPAIMQRLESGEVDRQFNELPLEVRKFVHRVLPIVGFASDTSPLSALATWASIVLARLPLSAHTPKDTPGIQSMTFTAARREHKRVETAVFEDIVERLFGGRVPTTA